MPRALSPQLLPASGSAIFPHFLLEDLLWQTGAKEEAPHPNTTTLALGNLTSLSCHDWSSLWPCAAPLTTSSGNMHGTGWEKKAQGGMSGRTDRQKPKSPPQASITSDVYITFDSFVCLCA